MAIPPLASSIQSRQLDLAHPPTLPRQERPIVMASGIVLRCPLRPDSALIPQRVRELRRRPCASTLLVENGHRMAGSPRPRGPPPASGSHAHTSSASRRNGEGGRDGEGGVW